MKGIKEVYREYVHSTLIDNGFTLANGAYTKGDRAIVLDPALNSLTIFAKDGYDKLFILEDFTDPLLTYFIIA